jgi:ankyrin repeat protein
MMIFGADRTIRFRWAVCQLESLSNCTSVDELEEALRSLPPTLPATYERILLQIPESHRTKVHVLLQWLTFQNGDWTWSGAAGLTLARAAQAAVVIPHSPFDPTKNRLAYDRDILVFTSSLVTLVDQQSEITVRIVITPPDWVDDDDPEVLQLAHASVKDYLTSEMIQNSDAKGFYISETGAHVTIAGACLQYLLSMNNEVLPDDTNEWPKRFPLMEYAAHNWNYHLRQVPEADSHTPFLMGLARKLLNGSSIAARSSPLQNWLLVLNKRGFSTVEQPSLMHYAVILNLPNLLRSLIPKGVGTGLEETSPDRDGTMPRIATMHGHDEISSILVRHKYYVTTASKKTHEVPLLLAIHHSKPELVELLLSQGAASDLVLMPTKSNILGTYLTARVKVDDNELGESDAEEFSRFKFTRKDIQYLVDHAKKATVRFHGFTSEARQFEFNGTLLHWVTLIQDEENFKKLLQNGAEVDEPFKEYGKGKSILGTTLYLALQGKSELMQNELLDRDTDPNAAVTTRWDSELQVGTVFHVAIRLGKVDIISRLLDKGARIEDIYEAKEDSFTTSTTALSIAVAYHHFQVIEVLLDRGANPQALTSTSMVVKTDWEAPLQFSSSRFVLQFRISVLGQDISSIPYSTLQKILDKGGLVNCPEEDVAPPMVAHITRTRIKTVEFLLSNGADVHYDGKFGTPLYHAAHLYDRTLENMLRERGAVDIFTVPYWTGL